MAASNVSTATVMPVSMPNGSVVPLPVTQSTAWRRPESHFRVFHLGRWVDGTDSWLGADGRKVLDAWVSQYELRDGAPTWVGIDVGLKRHSMAVVIGQRRPTGQLHTVAKVWLSNSDEAVDISDIMVYVRQLDSRYDLIEVAYDPRLFELPALQLTDEALPTVECPQSLERMTPTFGDLFEAIKRQEVSHSGDSQYAQQLLNAVPRLTERGFTLAKAQVSRQDRRDVCPGDAFRACQRQAKGAFIARRALTSRFGSGRTRPLLRNRPAIDRSKEIHNRDGAEI